MKNGWREKIIKLTLDSIFPFFCLKCEKEGNIVCEDCLKDFRFNGVFFCPVCCKINDNGQCCVSCENKSFLFKTMSLDFYKEDQLTGQLIRLLKYNYTFLAGEVINQKMKNFFKKRTGLLWNIDLIEPIPLHPRRFAERGFNQSELFANQLGKILDSLVSNILFRTKYTKQQVGLLREERQKNVFSAFAKNKKNTFNLKNKSILLVDDVYTTGSTMQECAKILLELGAKSVCGFTVGKG